MQGYRPLLLGKMFSYILTTLHQCAHTDPASTSVLLLCAPEPDVLSYHICCKKCSKEKRKRMRRRRSWKDVNLPGCIGEVRSHLLFYSHLHTPARHQTSAWNIDRSYKGCVSLGTLSMNFATWQKHTGTLHHDRHCSGCKDCHRIKFL